MNVEYFEDYLKEHNPLNIMVKGKLGNFKDRRECYEYLERKLLTEFYPQSSVVPFLTEFYNFDYDYACRYQDFSEPAQPILDYYTLSIDDLSSEVYFRSYILQHFDIIRDLTGEDYDVDLVIDVFNSMRDVVYFVAQKITLLK